MQQGGRAERLLHSRYQRRVRQRFEVHATLQSPSGGHELAVSCAIWPWRASLCSRARNLSSPAISHCRVLFEKSSTVAL